MSFRTLLLSGCVMLAGCQSADFVQPTSADVVAPASTFSALKTLDVELPSSTKIEINQYSQLLQYAGIDSPVAAFRVPANQGTLDLTLVSQITDKVFVPYAKIFDENGVELALIKSDSFEYKKPRLHWGNRLEAEFELTPMQATKNIVVVIYSDRSELGGYTEVIHPARLDAEARGNYLPEVKDIPVPHSMEGTVDLEVSSSGLIMAEPQKNTLVVQEPSKTLKVIPETQNYYLTAIQKAVESNNLDKALSLLDEAKALNIEGAQETFIKAVNKK
ncbi:MalM family protein [Vibrio sp. TBV020]|uniref:MalM family protein n=1 Tax=Vibrio sp. TBV020 TaxID=3137398 RepID=UPI0038CD4B5F